jgi:DNA (cytosine-5)-methyltransferase 1
LGLKIASSYRDIDTAPTVVNCDVRDVDFASIKITPDVLFGGPPCQDFSMAQGSQRPGLNGGRGKLYVEFVRAVMFLQPKIFIFENVPGLISANDKLVYQTIIGDLTNLEQKRLEVLTRDSHFHAPATSVHGYRIVFKGIVDSTRLGVPQTRKRLIIIGLRNDLANKLKATLEEIQVDVENELNGNNKLFAKFPMTCIETFEGKTLVDLQAKYKKVIEAYEGLSHGIKNPALDSWRKKVWTNLTFKIKNDYFLANQLSEISKDEFTKAMEEHHNLLCELGWLNKPVALQEYADNTNLIPKQTHDVTERMWRIPPDENYSFVDGTKWQVEGKSISFIYRKPAPLKPAPTVMAYGGGGTYGYHYERERVQLTLRERARLQTFSDEFLFQGNPTEKRAQIGEAVPPLLANCIATLVKKIIAAI